MRPRDTLPTKWEIVSFWAGMDGYRLCDRMGMNPECPMCFACRFFRPSWDAPKAPSDRWNKAPLVRAHIIAHASGGAATADNLVLLCKSCHDPPCTLAGHRGRQPGDGRRARRAADAPLVKATKRVLLLRYESIAHLTLTRRGSPGSPGLVREACRRDSEVFRDVDR